MTFTRRAWLGAALAGAFGVGHTQSNWPGGRPIRIVVPFAPGGATDVAARALGQVLGESLKTSVLIENRTGGHGYVGILEAQRAAPDGYTLLMASIGTMAINPRLHEKLPYDANKDFAPISLVTVSPNVVVINPTALPVNDMPGFLAYVKANPGRVNYGSAGSGNSGHIASEYFKARTGTFMTHIPYRGDSAAMADLIGGNIQVMFTAVLGAMPHIKSGRLKLLATTGRQRLSEFPDVPTVEEALKLKDFEVRAWQALYAPTGTPTEILSRLADEVNAALRQPALAKRLADLGALPGGGTPTQLAQFQLAEQEKWGKVIREAKIKAE